MGTVIVAWEPGEKWCIFVDLSLQVLQNS